MKPVVYWQKKEFSTVIWFGDLLALHGSDTRVWDLNLLVQDPREAATILLGVGYKETPPHSKFEDEAEFAERAIRMALVPSVTGVVLLPARDWYSDLNKSVQNSLLALYDFLDSIIEVWLNISSRDYVDRVCLALYIGCLITYCDYLEHENSKPVKDPAYANNLKPEYRNKNCFTTTDRHHGHARRSREIKEGTFMPQPYLNAAFQLPLTALSE